MTNEKSSSSFKGLLRSLDYFAVTFEFRVDKKPKFGSITGGSWFLIYIIIAIAYTLKRFFDYISWTDTKLQFIEKALDPGPSLNFKEMKFSYAIRVTFDNDTSLRNSSYSDLFVLEHSYVVAKDGQKKKKIKSQPRNCQNSDFYNQTDEFTIFNRQPISDFDCFDFYENFTLKGIYTDLEMSYSEVLLSLNEKYMQNYTELENIFRDYQFKFTLYYIDTFNDVSNFTKSVFYKLDAIYTYIDLLSFKRNNVNFQEFLNSIDKNLFYNDYKSSTFMKMFSSQEISAPIQDRSISTIEDRLNLNKFILRAVNNQKVVMLSFVKIPEFLASLSGLLVNLLVILAILIRALNTFEAKQSIMNKIMKYKDLIKSNNVHSLDYLSKKFKDHNFIERQNSIHSSRSKKQQEKRINDVITDGNDQIVLNTNKFNDVNLYLSKNEKYLKEESLVNKSEVSSRQRKSRENPYMIKLSDICCFVFCCRSLKKKKTLFKNAEEKFNHNIDLVTFMKKMQEVEILKYLVLDQDTLKLMNFISKPCISMTNNQTDDEEYKEFFENTDDNNNMSNENIDNVKKSYDNLVAKTQRSYAEERIIRLFDMQIQEIIA